MRKLLLTTAVALGAVFVAATARADAILSFGQSAGNAIVATADAGGTSTHLQATNASIGVTQIENGVAQPAVFNLSADSVGNAVSTLGAVAQHFSGNFSITNGAVNLLSGTFADVVFGVGPAAGLISGDPPDLISFTSDVITSLGLPRGIALSFADAKPSPLSIDNETLASFTSSVSGTFSANVPEPASLGLLGLGLLGLGYVRRQRA